MKSCHYIPVQKNVALLLIVTFLVGDINNFALDCSQAAKRKTGSEKEFEVFLNNGQTPYQYAFELSDPDNEYREGSKQFIHLLFQDFVPSFDVVSPKIPCGNHFNNIHFFASPLFIINSVFQV